MSFAARELLPLLFGVPLSIWACRSLLARRAQAELAWVGRALAPRLRSGGAPRPAWLVATWIALALFGMTLALARPRWGVASEKVDRRGIDLVFVLDTSLSMAAADVSPSRFWLAQSLVRQLVGALPGHRVALVAAEGEGEVLSPLTLDAAVIDLLLDGLEPGSLPLPGTRLAPALERALALFPAANEKHRAIVILSDGEAHGEKLGNALEALREAGAIVHSIGIGTERGAPIPLSKSRGEFKRDRRGEVVVSRLDRSGLRALTEATSGIYLEANSAAIDVQPIVDEIAAMGGRRLESTTLDTLEERFQWPLVLAALALAATLALSPWRTQSGEDTA